MNRKRFWQFFFLFTFCIFSVGMIRVYAAPTVTIVSPNGGEIWNGTKTINWVVSDSTISQKLDANIWYSNPPSKTWDSSISIAKDINLFQYCSFSIDPVDRWDLNNGLATGFSSGGYGSCSDAFASSPALFSYNGITRLITLFCDNTGTRVRAWDWNGTQWKTNYDFNKGITIPSVGTMYGVHVFYYKGILRALTFSGVAGFDWNGTQWVSNSSISNGLGSVYSFATFEKNGFLYGISNAGTSFSGYQLGTTSWIPNNNIILDLNFGLFDSTIGILNDNNKIYFFLYFSEGTIVTYEFNGFNWSFSDQDFGFSNIGNYKKGISINKIDDSGKYVFVLNELYNQVATQWLFYNRNNYPFDTRQTMNCNYPWDTTKFPNGNWYIDLNVSNGLTMTNDSSNGLFSITNLNSSDINAICVRNCSFGGYDGNSLIINPVDESQEIVFKVNNNDAAKSVRYRIPNSLKDGKRYFVYSSSFDGNYSFDYTLNWGSGGTNNIDGLQKIWNPITRVFDYFITDTLQAGANGTKYYSLKYQMPAKQWFSIGNSNEWDNQLTPQSTDYNGLTMDFWQTSSYAQINSVLKEKIPSITTVPNQQHVFVFTAKTTNGSNTIAAGTVTTKGDTPGDTSPINSTEKTFDFDDSIGGYETLKTTGTGASTIQAYDYALIPEDLFIKGVEIKNQSGQELPTMLSGSSSLQYVKEGEKYKVQATLYDREGTLKKVEVFTYLEKANDSNLAGYAIFDYTGTTTPGQTINLNLEMPGLTDFTANNKKMLVKVRATKQANNPTNPNTDYNSETSSVWLEFVQFPNNPGDLTISANLVNTIVAQSPKFFFNVHITVPNALRGVDFRIYDDNQSWGASDYNTVFWKDTDFVCNGFDCSFQKDITKYVFPRAGHWRMTAIALLTTTNIDINNSLTSVTNNFIVDWKSWQIAKIFDVVERGDRIYRNDEKIPLALVLRTSDYTNLKNELIPKLRVWNCSAVDSSDCLEQDVNYSSSGFYYNKGSGLNIWYFNNVFALQNGLLLPDSNFVRFSAILTDTKGQFQATLQPLLTTRCQTGHNASDLLSNAIVSMVLYPLLGCDVGFQTPDIVAIDSNQAMESRIEIDAIHDVNAPNFIGFYCINNDLNNLFKNTLKQTVSCDVAYAFNETNIDKFDVYFTNQYSDLSRDPKNGQYIKITIPYELIAANDITLLNQEIKAKYGNTPTDLWGLITGAFNNFVSGTGNWVLNTLGLRNGSPVSSESIYAGSQSDTNYYHPVTIAEGMFVIDLIGIKVINKDNYLSKYPDLNTVNTKDFLEYSAYKGYVIPIEKTHYVIHVATDPLTENSIYEGEIDSPLVVNVATTENVLVSNDANIGTQTLPYYLNFTIIMDMFYNTIQVKRDYRDLLLTGYIEDFGVPAGTGQGVTKIIDDLGNSLNALIDRPTKWLTDNWFGVFILAVGGLYVALVYRKFKGSGGEINVNTLIPGR